MIRKDEPVNIRFTHLFILNKHNEQDGLLWAALTGNPLVEPHGERE